MSAGLGDGCSGMGHLEDRLELSAALHQASPSAHAALPHKAPQVQTIKSVHNAVFSLKKVACGLASYTAICLKTATFISLSESVQELWMQKNCSDLQLQIVWTPILLITIFVFFFFFK